LGTPWRWKLDLQVGVLQICILSGIVGAEALEWMEEAMQITVPV
jgi:hypothetical protein